MQKHFTNTLSPLITANIVCQVNETGDCDLFTVDDNVNKDSIF